MCDNFSNQMHLYLPARHHLGNVCWVILLCTPFPETWYVLESGSDRDGCGRSVKFPCQTLLYLLQQVNRTHFPPSTEINISTDKSLTIDQQIAVSCFHFLFDILWSITQIDSYCTYHVTHISAVQMIRSSLKLYIKEFFVSPKAYLRPKFYLDCVTFKSINTFQQNIIITDVRIQ